MTDIAGRGWRIAHRLYALLMGIAPGRKARSFLRDTTYVYAGTAIAGLITVAGFIASTRVLGPAMYGSYVLAVAVSVFGAMFMVMGYPSAATVHLARTGRRSIAGTALLTTGALALLWAGILLALSGPIAGALHMPRATFTAGAALAIGLAMFAITESVVRGLRRMRLLASLRVIAAAVNFLTLAALLLAGLRTFLAPVLGMLAGQAAHAAVAWWRVRPRLGIDPWALRQLTSYGMRSWFSGIGNTVIYQFDKVLMNFFAGAEAVGIYGAYATASISVADRAAQPLSHVFLPMASAHKDKALVRTMTVRMLLRAAPLLLGAFALVIAVLMRLVGSAYPLRLDYTLLFAGAAVLRFTEMLLGRLTLAMGIHGAHAAGVHGMIAAVIAVGLNVALIPRLGATGAVLALIIAGLYVSGALLGATGRLVRTRRTGL